MGFHLYSAILYNKYSLGDSFSH
uniref:Uncharacterized protein n=1 Tax=Anguilla anguilla TaxID=7936 RepID=A0A0E9XAV5_ANGAN